MTKTALLKLFVAIVITIILILPEYFKTPRGNILELSCLEVGLQPNFTYLPTSLNFTFIRESQIIRGIFLNHSNFQNFTEICEDIMSEVKMCSSLLVCESKGNTDFISQEQTSKVLILRRSKNVKASDFRLPCQHLNFSVASVADHLEEYNTTCNLNNHTRNSAILVENSVKEKSINHSCRITEDPNNCIHISLHLEMNIKNFICSMKITWYALLLFFFILLIIFITHKILEGHRRIQKRQNHRYKTTSVLLRESGSEKLRTLNTQVISVNVGECQENMKQRKLNFIVKENYCQKNARDLSICWKWPQKDIYSCLRKIENTQKRPLTQVNTVLAPIPELEVTSAMHQQDEYTQLSL